MVSILWGTGVHYNKLLHYFIIILGHSDMVWSAAYSRIEQDLFVSVSQVCLKCQLLFFFAVISIKSQLQLSSPCLQKKLFDDQIVFLW